MKSELITPQMIARAPNVINMKPSVYSHEMQCVKGAASGAFTVTFNATQTFDYKGAPKDSDND